MPLAPFDVLFEADLPAYKLPVDLRHLYGGLGFATPILYSNFVASVDGVATLGSTPSAGSVISGKYPADRFLMGLLRACADAVVIGAGTLRATPGHLWIPAHVYPEMATEFTVLRSNLSRTTEPKLVVVTAGGDIDPSHPALVKGAIVMTTEGGAKAIGSRLPATCEVVTVGKGKSLDVSHALDELRSRGLKVLLTEAGPHLMGQLIEKGLLDEAFLTISPVMAGRQTEAARAHMEGSPRTHGAASEFVGNKGAHSDSRLGMVEGVELLPKRGVWSALLSVRRHGDYLFLRYRVQA